MGEIEAMGTIELKLFKDNFKPNFRKLGRNGLSIGIFIYSQGRLVSFNDYDTLWQCPVDPHQARDNAHVAVDMPQRQRVARRLGKESNHSPDSPMCSKPHQPRWENSTPETERNYWGVDDSPQQTPEADLESSGADTDNQGTGTEADLESSGADTDNQGTGTEADLEISGADTDNQGTGTEADLESNGADTDNQGTGTEADLESSGADTDNQGTGTEADLESSGADTDNQGTGTPPPSPRHNQGGGGGDNQDTGTPPPSPRHNQGRGGGGNRWTSSSTITTIFMTFPTMLILYVISKDGRALSKDTRYEWTPYAVMVLANAALISMMIGLCSSSSSWLFKCFKWIGIVLFFCALYIMQLPVLVT